MSSKQQVIDSIVVQGMLPLFFYADEEVSLQIIRTLYKAGVRVLEYTNRGTAALDNFIALKKAQRQEMPGLYLGAGTVKSVEEAEAFIGAGADFLVSPVVNTEVGKIAARHNMLWIPGCMSPTEIYLAQQNGAAIIKIFPASVLGPGFVNAVKEVFAGQLFIPTGGVGLSREGLLVWFNAGVCAVGMGSRLISENILKNRLYEQLYTDTTALLETIKSVKG